MNKPAKFSNYIAALLDGVYGYPSVAEDMFRTSYGMELNEVDECRGYLDYVVEHDMVERKTCHFIPEVTWYYEDENGEEIDTELMSPFDDCGAADCSACGGAMSVGDCGWFNEEEQPNGEIKLIPKFEYCPYCGAKVAE